MKLSLTSALAVGLVASVGVASVAVGVVTQASAQPSSRQSGPSSSAAPTTLRGAGCAEVGFVAIDATGDGWSDLASAGPTMQALVGAAEDRVARAGSTSTTYHLGQPFASSSSLAGGETSGRATTAVTKERVQAWQAGIKKATGTVVHRLESLATACPEQAFVLAGIVQGAGVVHRVLLKSESMPSLKGRLAGAALVSDPYRTSGSAAELIGAPAARATGSGAIAKRLNGLRDVPTSSQDLRVVSVCSEGDLVCDLRGWPVARSLEAFTSYLGADGLEGLDTAAKRLVQRVGAWPRVAAKQTFSVPTRTRFSGDVEVRVGSAYRGTTVFAPVGDLPTGVKLSRAGVLSGKLRDEGTWKVPFTVRGTDPVTSAAEGTLILRATEATLGRTVVGGGQNTCFVGTKGAAYCLGDNASGQVGDGTSVDRSEPTRVGTDSDWATIDTSGATTCGVKTSGDLYCWGMNNRSQLGLGDTGRRWTPQRVGGSDWAQVSTSWLHTCGVRTSGKLYCWGENNRGQLGIGSHANKSKPARVGSGDSWASVTTGGWHTCAVKTDGTAWCWGLNDIGQLGTGGTASTLRPTAVDSTRTWSALDSTWSSTCGRTSSDLVLCWGLNDQGQLGDGTQETRTSPALVTGDHRWTDFALGDAHACGLDDGGRAWCWGENTYGQLGNGTRQDSLRPARVAGGGTWSGLDAGWLHTCATSSAGELECWGNNEAGQLARGDHQNRSTPPGVQARSLRVARRAARARTVVTSFNVLGSQHTRPGGGAKNYAPGRIRSEWTVNQLKGLKSGIVAFQELQVDQYQDLKHAIGDRYDFYPHKTGRTKVVWQSVMWEQSQWTFQDAVDVWVPVIGTTRPNPMVRLRNVKTGHDVWVFNVHNSSKNNPKRQRERNRAVRMEIARILEQRNDDVPVIFLGDMNERVKVFCKVVGQTDLEAVTGGSHTGGTCRPPRTMHLDWMFASPELTVHSARFVRTPMIARITDHSILTSRMTAP